MSYLSCVVPDGEARYVLTKVGGMRVPVTAFLSEKLMAGTDEKLWQQAANAASYDGVEAVYLHADTHVGYHVPVGGTIITESTIALAGSGFDISCGVLHARIEGIDASKVVDKPARRSWIEAVERRVALGIGSHRPEGAAKLSEKEVRDCILYGAKPLGVSADLCERVSLPVSEDFDPSIYEKAWAKAPAQLGSLGGGNHFIELQCDPTDGSVWIMIHSGSRGFGWQVADHFYHEASELRGLPKNRREEAWVYADEPLGKAYWAAHNAAANYAIANRWRMFLAIAQANEEVFGARTVPFYEISHNLVQKERTIVDGNMKYEERFVHRKGATRALPAGHPDLAKTGWAERGHPILIPGSMYTGAAILSPKSGAALSGFSVNHGCGRVLGRGQAKRQLAPLQGDIDDQMATVKRTFGGVEVEGVLTNSRNTPLDECNEAYKSLDEVLDVLRVNNIAEVQHRLYPVASIKGME